MLESQTGTYAPFGIANMTGTLIAFDEINAAGGVTVDGKKVKIQVTPGPNGYDAGIDPAQSISLLKRELLDDKVLMIKGVSNSNAGTAVVNYLAELEKEGNPIVVHSSSVGTPGLTKLSQYAFRNSFIEMPKWSTVSSTRSEETQAKSAGSSSSRTIRTTPRSPRKFIIPALKSGRLSRSR
jgi:ABC-type branched-subunit amino acid transport system substrate-binding protein